MKLVTARGHVTDVDVMSVIVSGHAVECDNCTRVIERYRMFVVGNYHRIRLCLICGSGPDGEQRIPRQLLDPTLDTEGEDFAVRLV